MLKKEVTQYEKSKLQKDPMAIDKAHLTDSYRDKRSFEEIVSEIDWLEKIK